MLRQTFRCIYKRKILQKSDTPATALEKITGIINEYLEDDALPFALANKKYRLAIITARARGLVAFRKHLVTKNGIWQLVLYLTISAVDNIYRFVDRVVFYNGFKTAMHFVLNRNSAAITYR
jgi:hypothetical protein